MSAGLLSVSIESLAGQTDRQIHSFFYSGRGSSKPTEDTPELPFPDEPKSNGTSRQRLPAPSSRTTIHRDPDHPNDPRYAWRIPAASAEAVCDVDGIPIDGEAVLNNMVLKGILRKEDVERVKKQKRERDARRAAEAAGSAEKGEVK